MGLPVTMARITIDGRGREPDDRLVIAERERPASSGSRAALAAYGVAGLALLLALTGIALHVLPGRVPAGDYGSWWLTNAVAAVAIALPGGLVAARRPRNPLGWLLLALALAHAVTVVSRE